MPIRPVVEFLSVVFFIALLFPVVVLAALTITDVSPTTINSADDVITISASASGLSSSTQYLQAAITREAATTNYLGLTKNLSDEWYLYKSSPTTSDLGSYFYRFVPTGSTWSGKLQVKIDVNDDGFLGPGNYVLKLIKYISSSGSLSNNSVTITVNVASPSSQTTTTTDTPSVSPGVTVNLDSNFFLGEEFGIGLKLTNFDSNQGYFLKFRAGLDDNSLSKGQTKNGSAFYADNESWSKFPQITTDGSGHWEGQITGRVGEDKTSGQYVVRVRVHKKDSDTFYDSASKAVSFAISPIVIVDSPNATKTAGPVKIASNSARDLNLVLGTASAATIAPFVSNLPPDVSKNPTPEQRNVVSTAMILIGLGTLISSLVLLSIRFRIWEKLPFKV